MAAENFEGRGTVMDAREGMYMIKKITSDNYKSGVTVVEGRLVLKDSVSHV